MSDLEEEILKGGYRLAAVETIVIDLMANMHRAGRDPVRTAEAYRERFRNMLAQNPEPHDTLLIRVARREVGYITRPPALGGRYQAYMVEGVALAGDHPLGLSAALACSAYALR
jgi:hypothetical protein